MASTPRGDRKNKEVQHMRQQDEGPTASRLRSKSKIADAKTPNTESTAATYVEKSPASQNSRHHQKDNKSNNSAVKKGELLHTSSTNRASRPSTNNTNNTNTNNNNNNNKRTKKTNDSALKIREDKASSGTIPPSNDHHHVINKISIKDSTRDAQRKQDSRKQNVKSTSDRRNLNSSMNHNKRPKKMEDSAAKKSDSLKPFSSNDQINKMPKPSEKPPVTINPFKNHPIYYIRWKGFDTATGWSCALCEKDLACSPDTEENEEDSSDDEEYKLEHLFSSPIMGMEHEQNSLLPEVTVLACSHAFHSMCFCVSEMHISDIPCPICASF